MISINTIPHKIRSQHITHSYCTWSSRGIEQYTDNQSKEECFALESSVLFYLSRCYRWQFSWCTFFEKWKLYFFHYYLFDMVWFQYVLLRAFTSSIFDRSESIRNDQAIEVVNVRSSTWQTARSCFITKISNKMALLFVW